MMKHTKKQRQILQDVPGERGVAPGSVVDFDHGNQKPGPMQEQINPGDTKQVDRPLTKAGHRETYNTSAGGVTIAPRRSVRPGREVLGEGSPLLRYPAFCADGG